MNKKILQFEFKDNIWKFYLSLMISFLVCFVFRLTVYTVYLQENRLTFSQLSQETTKINLNHLSNYGYLFLCFYGIAIYLGLTMFSYLHKEDKLLLYNSMPVKKVSVLVTKYFVGVSYILLCYVVAIISVYLLDSFVYPEYTKISIEFIMMCMTYFLRFIFLYTLFMFVNILLGNGIYTIFGVGCLLLMPVTLLMNLNKYIGVPYRMNRLNGLENYYYSLFLDQSANQYLVSSTYGVLSLILLLLTSLMLLYGIWLLQRRKIERVHHTIIFEKGEFYCRQIILYTFLSFFLLIMKDMVSSRVPLFLFVSLIFVLITFVLEIIIKGGIPNIKIKILFLQPMLAIFLFFGTVLLAKSNIFVNTYMSDQSIPSIDEVRYVACSVKDEGDSLYSSTRDYVYVEKEDIQNILQLHTELIAMENINEGDLDHSYDKGLFSFSYMLMDGTVTSSFYYGNSNFIMGDQLASGIAKIHSDQDYTKNLILFMKEVVSREDVDVKEGTILYDTGNGEEEDLIHYPYREYQWGQETAITDTTIPIETSELYQKDANGFLDAYFNYSDFDTLDLLAYETEEGIYDALYLKSDSILLRLNDVYKTYYSFSFGVTPIYQETYDSMKQMINKTGVDVALYTIYAIDDTTRNEIADLFKESNRNFNDQYVNSVDTYLQNNSLYQLDVTTSNYEEVYDKFIVPNYRVTKERLEDDRVFVLYDPRYQNIRFCIVTDPGIFDIAQ